MRIHAKPPAWLLGLGKHFLEVRPPSMDIFVFPSPFAKGKALPSF